MIRAIFLLALLLVSVPALASDAGSRRNKENDDRNAKIEAAERAEVVAQEKAAKRETERAAAPVLPPAPEQAAFKQAMADIDAAWQGYWTVAAPYAASLKKVPVPPRGPDMRPSEAAAIGIAARHNQGIDDIEAVLREQEKDRSARAGSYGPRLRQCLEELARQDAADRSRR